jgi:hypothetical protein
MGRWTRRAELILALGLPVIAFIAILIAVVMRWARDPS